ncbi:MAG: hypothetical protein ACFE94_12505 [Candidatus Hodarchaeota archaeon]
MPALAHFGIGLAAKRFTPQVSLWILLISVMFIDLLSFIFLFAIWITHGLFMSIFWSIIAIIITALIKMRLNSKKNQENKNNSSMWNAEVYQISIIIGFLVFSHWILDFIGWPMTAVYSNSIGTPLLFDDAVNIGLGVYSTLFGAILMDLGVFCIGLVFYIHYKITTG